MEESGATSYTRSTEEPNDRHHIPSLPHLQVLRSSGPAYRQLLAPEALT